MKMPQMGSSRPCISFIPMFLNTLLKLKLLSTGLGDQLSVERAVHCISSLANGFTLEERLDGLHVEIADWQAELKFLAVS